MPISTFMGLQTALRGILAQQRALDTTSHNIANANTVGYTRQEAVLVATPGYTEPGLARPPQAGTIGTGVDVSEYRRMRDVFIDIQLRAQMTLRGMYDAKSDGLEQVELAFAEPSDSGLSKLLGRYWAAWQDVANAPESLATRQALAQLADTLADGFRNLSSQLTTIQAQASQDMSLTFDEVTSIGARIAALNQSIQAARVAGDQPNDLYDQRDILIDRLWELGNVTVTDQANGVVDVSFGGATLVDDFTASTLSTLADTPSLTSGKLQGLVDLDTAVTGYLTTLDSIAAQLIAQTNAQHAAGYDLGGNAGGAFFTGTGASDIAVDSSILSTPALIAAADSWAGAGEPGNAGNALAIAGLRTTTIAALGGATIDTAYSQLVTTVGSDARESFRQLENTEVLSDALTNRRDSVSGVSLDEEMTNLIRFQRAFQASARALSAMDEMIDVLVNRMGRVGL